MRQNLVQKAIDSAKTLSMHGCKVSDFQKTLVNLTEKELKHIKKVTKDLLYVRTMINAALLKINIDKFFEMYNNKFINKE